MRNKKSTFALLLTLTTIMSSCKKSEDYSYPNSNFTNNIVVYVNGSEYKYKDIYNLFNDQKESASAYFSIANSVLVQLVTPRTSAMKTIVEGKMEDYHDQWTTNAKNNNTSYDEEKESTLSSEGVLDEEALENKLYVSEQTSDNESAYLKDNPGENDYSYYISESATKKFVTDNAPYHVSHILIKVDASSDGTGLTAGQISSDNAEKIGTVFKNLITSDTFGSIAQQLSDDTSSAAKYGELADSSSGVAMEKRTSYINEFKLGVYAYDAFINKSNSEDENGTKIDNSSLKKSLRVPGQTLDDGSEDMSVASSIVKTNIYNKQVFGIPLSIALTMSAVASKEKSDAGSKPTNASETQYPRNIYFNNYFNQHSVSFVYDDSDEYDANFLASIQETYKNDTNYKDIKYITDEEDKKANSGTSTGNSVEKKLSTRYEEYSTVKKILDTYTKDRTTDTYKKKFTKFSSIVASDAKLVSYTSEIKKDSSTNKYYASNTLSEVADCSNKNILTDESGNPIIVVRGGSDSYQGIHLITINKDPFKNGTIDSDAYKYWTVTLPDNTKTAASYSSSYKDNPTFINFVTDSTAQKTVYKERATMIRNDIKAANSSLQTYELWDYNLEKFKEKTGKDFLDLLGDSKNTIVSYVDSIRKGTTKSSGDTLDDSWETYVKLLNLASEKQKRDLIPNVCVGYFNRGSYSIKETSDATTDTFIGSGCHVDN